MRGRADAIEALLAPVVTGLGYELVGIEHLRQGRGSLLRVFIDKAGGITVSDCERVSRQLSGVLEVEDPIRGAYTLEVSSPGTDRPLFTTADFVRFTGEAAQVRFAEPWNGRRQMRGRLAGVEGGELLLDAEDGMQRVPLAVIARAKLADTPEPVADGRKPRRAGRAGGNERTRGP
ncbi:MAG: ribosome maturation factor RimP [Kofleriaceae bacterium]|nr:ribosome maturation factor RimP [Kofleriaceae bacterium]